MRGAPERDIRVPGREGCVGLPDLDFSVCMYVCVFLGGSSTTQPGDPSGDPPGDPLGDPRKKLCGFYADSENGKTYYSYADLMLSYKNTNNYKVFRCWAIINYEQISKKINKYQQISPRMNKYKQI